MVEFEEAPKTKNGILPSEDNLNSELYKHAEATFLERLLFFNNIYMMGEMPENWKNSVVMYMYV